MVFTLVFKSILMQVVQKRVYVFLSFLWGGKSCGPVCQAVPPPHTPAPWEEAKVGPITRCSSQAAMMH